ncbi:MAG: hypothetical protein AB1641_20885 [Thermodesulfobacteriota bacterium]
MLNGSSQAAVTTPEDGLAAINAELDGHASAHLLDETWLRRGKQDIEETMRADQAVGRLTLARLNELALYLAGSYADAGLVREAGDLLVNPPVVWVYLEGRTRRVKKERHTPLTEQFAPLAGHEDPKAWLRKNAKVVVGERPLLIELADALKPLAAFRPGYLDSVLQRHQRIADTINLVCGLHVPEDSDFLEHLYRMPLDQREFMKAGFCRFNLDLFWRLGREIFSSSVCPGTALNTLIADGNYKQVPV